MDVEYTTVGCNGEEKQEIESVSNFLVEELFNEKRWNCNFLLRLEDQPKRVLETLGRLIERLLEKNVFNLDDLKYIAECNWGRKANSLQLKKDENV